MRARARAGAGARECGAALVAAALMLCACACVRPGAVDEPVSWMGLRLEPGVILTTAEGAYILDLLWLKTGAEAPGVPRMNE